MPAKQYRQVRTYVVHPIARTRLVPVLLDMLLASLIEGQVIGSSDPGAGVGWDAHCAGVGVGVSLFETAKGTEASMSCELAINDSRPRQNSPPLDIAFTTRIALGRLDTRPAHVIVYALPFSSLRSHPTEHEAHIPVGRGQKHSQKQQQQATSRGVHMPAGLSFC
ncbi:hypothetical protein F5Y15DRAFT_365174 [Xylariaceae sp. FL0016]|nr:hypothetical protein F5Y15DRAFT_365174 [Xylariaceae sp. FL0016]